MRLFPVEYNGFDLTSFRAYFSNPFGMGESAQGSTTTSPRYQDFPDYGGKTLQPTTLTMKIPVTCPPETRNDLARYLDTSDDAEHKLLAYDMDGKKEWYVDAVCIGLTPNGEDAKEWTAAFLVVNPIWKSNTLFSSAKALTPASKTITITPGGNKNARPILSIKPTSAKSAGSGVYRYSRFCSIYNRVNSTLTNYPFTIVGSAWDTATVIAAGKMLATGNDLRVFIDGVEVDRWLVNINTANTRVWANLNFSPKQEFTLAVAIAATGSISYIQVNEDISAMPDTGILLNGSELFTYTSRDTANKRFNGVTRGAKGSSMALHAVSSTTRWIEHDIWIYYGCPTAGTPPASTATQPLVMASTTNAAWIYVNFMSVANPGRSGAWQKTSGTVVVPYTANHGTDADPASEMGLKANGGAVVQQGIWSLTNPCGITDWNFSNGEKYRSTSRWFLEAALYADGTKMYDIPTPAAAAGWEAWSDARAIGFTAHTVSIKGTNNSSGIQYAEVDDVTITILSTGYPVLSFGAEQDTQTYYLNARITNTLTGKYIDLIYSMYLGINNTLEVDTDEKDITYLYDGSNAFSALQEFSPMRTQWLELTPGVANILQYDETGFNNVTLTVQWRDRQN